MPLKKKARIEESKENSNKNLSESVEDEEQNKKGKSIKKGKILNCPRIIMKMSNEYNEIVKNLYITLLIINDVVFHAF
jgi:hypothetical protein